jgi:serine/threonine-protein kinase
MVGIQLITLGRTELTRPDGRAVLSVLSQPKRFALLVYLAVEGSRGLIRRDTVAALFWPEHDQGDARANLRKSLHFLRKSLGRRVVVTRGDEEVGIDASLLRCDAVALLEGGQIPVEGDFLDGFHFSGASIEWEDWLESVRERVRACAPELDGPELPMPAASHEPSEEERRPPTLGRVSRWRRIAFGASVLALILLAGLGLGLLRPKGGFNTRVRYDRIVLGSGVQAPRIVHRHYALPPDGSGILFPDTVDGKWESLWKPLDQLSPAPIPGTGLLASPVFSPDGRWIAFAEDGYLLKQSPDGVTSLVLADSVSRDSSPGIAWLSNGRILFEDADFDLRSLPEEGGDPELVATQEELGHVFHVSGLPDGSGALVVGCVLTCESAVPRLYFVDLERGDVVALRSGVWMAWAMPEGRVVMVDGQGAVSAAAFDPARGELDQPVPLLNGVQVSPFPEITLGPDGSLLYIPGGIEPTVRMPVWVQRDGHEEPVDPDWPPLWNPRSMSLSPDGTRMAVGMRPFFGDSLGEQIWIKELSRGPFAPLTVGPHQARRPVWSPDGSTLVFITQFQQGDGTWTSFVSGLPADASSQETEERLRPARPILEVVLTSDGGTAVVRTGDAATGEGNIAFASLGDAPELQSLLDSRAGEYSIDLSPDDRWLAYVSEVSGRPEVYVRPFPGPGPRVQVTIHGGVEPRWSHSGKELFFRSLGTGGTDPDPPSFMAAQVITDPVFRVESTTRLFRDRYWRGPHVRLYDVSADGQRFIVILPNIYNLTQGAVVYSRGWYWSDEVQARLRE